MTALALADLLRRTADAHHVFELSERTRRNDPTWRDDDWPTWYAHYILTRPDLFAPAGPTPDRIGSMRQDILAGVQS